MHEYNTQTCKEHYCDTCIYSNHNAEEHPCYDCINNLSAKGCYWEKDLSCENDQIEYIISLLRELTDEKRLEIFNCFCKFCGCDNQKCQCGNDE